VHNHTLLAAYHKLLQDFLYKLLFWKEDYEKKSNSSDWCNNLQFKRSEQKWPSKQYPFALAFFFCFFVLWDGEDIDWDISEKKIADVGLGGEPVAKSVGDSGVGEEIVNPPIDVVEGIVSDAWSDSRDNLRDPDRDGGNELSVDVEEWSESVDNFLENDAGSSDSERSPVSNKRFKDFSRSSIWPSSCASEKVLPGIETVLLTCNGEGGEGLEVACLLSGGGKIRGLAIRGRTGLETVPTFGLIGVPIGEARGEETGEENGLAVVETPP